MKYQILGIESKEQKKKKKHLWRDSTRFWFLLSLRIVSASGTAVLVSRLLSAYAAETGINLYDTKNQSENQTKNPDTLCNCRRHVGGINVCGCDPHSCCHVTSHNYFLPSDRGAGRGWPSASCFLCYLWLTWQEIAGLLRESSFGFLKTKQLSCLIWKCRVVGRRGWL